MKERKKEGICVWCVILTVKYSTYSVGRYVCRWLGLIDWLGWGMADGQVGRLIWMNEWMNYLPYFWVVGCAWPPSRPPSRGGRKIMRMDGWMDGDQWEWEKEGEIRKNEGGNEETFFFLFSLLLDLDIADRKFSVDRGPRLGGFDDRYDGW